MQINATSRPDVIAVLQCMFVHHEHTKSSQVSYAPLEMLSLVATCLEGYHDSLLYVST